MKEIKDSIRGLREALLLKEQVLLDEYHKKAQQLCPYKVGGIIEYDVDEVGVIDSIIWVNDEMYINIEDQEPEYWVAEGRKINKNNRVGKRRFRVGNRSHVIDGDKCRPKDIGEFLKTYNEVI